MIPKPEREALFDLYKSTGGDNWVNNVNWLDPPGTECSWDGVSCDESEMHVVEISLSWNNLNGVIPNSIGNLQNLSSLYLENNQLSSLPESFGELKNLSGLDLSNNQLSSLPESFGELKNLSGIALSNNQLSSLPESFDKLQNLSELYLAGNLFPSINIDIPKFIAEDSESVQCTLTVDAPINRDVNLIIDFSNPDKVTIAETVTLPKGYTQVNFSISVIDDMLVTGPTNITINTAFQLFNHDIVLFALDYINEFLPIITDNDLNVSIIIPESATEGEQSVEGIIRINQPLDSDIYIPLISSGNKLINLPETAKIPKGLTEGIFNFSINEFDIKQSILIKAYGMLISETIQLIPRMIPESERAALIDLYNSTDGDHWNHNELWLGDPGTECSWYGVFCDESEMHVVLIFLPWNNLNGVIPNSIGNLQNLSSLSLSDNQLSSLPESFGELKNLSYLYLYNNQLSSLPESFGELKNLSDLYLYNNQLSSLPESFGELKNLSDLNLSDNLFPSLYLSIPEVMSEGSENVQCTLTVSTPINRDVNLMLDFSNPNKLTIAETVILPKGFTQVNFYLSVIDDMLLTGPTEITVNTAFQLFNNDKIISALDYSKQFLPFIIDNELKVLTIILPESATEGDQSLEGIIRIDQPVDCDVYIPLSSIGNNLINLPETAKISKGLTEGIFNFSINEFDTKQSILIEAHGMMVSENIQLIPRMISESEREALIDFYNSTDGDNWYQDPLWGGNIGWLGERGTECSWGGVVCDENETHVIAMHYRGNNLNGVILASIGNLQNLSFLDLSDNQLSSLPESFGNLKELKELYLFDNQLSSLPESFGNLQNLSYLDLNFNQLSSLPENFGNLQNLSNLDLIENQLSRLPENFGNLQNLSNLDLLDNQLSSLPENFGNLQNLSILRIDNNQLRSLPVNFENIQNLSSLSLDNNQLSSLPVNFENIQNLSYLSLSNNQLSSLPVNFENIQNLSYLSLSNNQLSSLPENFGNLKELKELYLSDNQLSSLPESFGNLKELKELYLSDNQLSSLPESFGNLK
jgi:Leucine-rich repeat (LRR) protein